MRAHLLPGLHCIFLKKIMAELITQKALAVFLGVTRGAIYSAEKRGRIKAARVEQRGNATTRWFDPDQCRADWENNRGHARTRPTRGEMGRGAQPRNAGEGISPNDITSQAGAREGDQGTKAAAGAGPVPSKNKKNSNLITYADARAEGEAIKTQKERIKLLKEQNRLLDVEKTKRFLIGFGRQIQQNIMNIPARMTGQLEKKQIILLENELRQALEVLSEITVNLESCLTK